MARKARVRTATEKQTIRRIGRQIKRAREDRGFTQDQLADLLGYTWGTSILMLEQGHNGPYAYDIVTLSRIFDKPTWWWFGDDVWPQDLDDWVVLAQGDRKRAEAHFDLDNAFEPISQKQEA